MGDKDSLASGSTRIQRTIFDFLRPYKRTNNGADPCEDFAYYINSDQTLDDLTRAALLNKQWSLPHFYFKNKKGVKNKVQNNNLNKFTWLVFSYTNRGLYCKYCALFAKNDSQTPLQKLINEPLQDLNKLTWVNGSLAKHEKTSYHRRAEEAETSFVDTFNNKIVKENRDRLKPIIETIIFCGQQNITLGGHHDSGPLRFNDIDSPVNEGNFRALLKLRIDSGDKILEEHLKTSSKATYIPKSILNAIIDLCKKEIQATIINNVKEAKYFSVIFDATNDISDTEQLSLSLRYLKNNKIREDFVLFCKDALENNDESLTGNALAGIVTDLCKRFDLDILNCVGIGADNCSVWASVIKEAINKLTENASHIKKCPCYNHILNYSLARSSEITSCRNAWVTMKKLVEFVSANKGKFSQDIVTILCNAPWEERHDGCLHFKRDLLLKICNKLTEISNSQDIKSAYDAYILRNALYSSDFIIAFICLADVLGSTNTLSRFLQKTTLDSTKASNMIENTEDVLVGKQKKSVEHFHKLFVEAQDLAEKLGTDIKAPRKVPPQTPGDTYRENDEEYFHRTVYIQLLDSIIADLRIRFSPDTMNFFRLGILMPKTETKETDLSDVGEISEFYSHFLGVPAPAVFNEYALWVSKWRREHNEPKLFGCVVSAIEKCDEVFYPNIKILLKILATLPICTATSEKLLSTSRRVETWLKESMLKERLTGLALLNIYSEITPDVSNIINGLAKIKIPFKL